MKYEDKKTKIQKLKEDQFRKNVLIPLFKAMGFNDVRDNHGPTERGKDIIFRSVTPWGHAEVSAAVVTMEDITGNVSDDNFASRVLDQVKMALWQEYNDIYTGKKTKVDRCLVISAGRIKSTAMDSISGQLEATSLDRLVTFFDLEKVIELVDRFYPELWQRDIELAYPVSIKRFDMTANKLVDPYNKEEDGLSAAGSLKASIYGIKKLVHSLLLDIEFDLVEKLEKILETDDPREILSTWEELETERTENGGGTFSIGFRLNSEIDQHWTYLFQDLQEYEEKYSISRM